MEIKTGMIMENRIPNSNTVIVVRVMEKLDTIGELKMWRVVDVRHDNGKSDEKLIDQNLTWGCPEENLFYHDEDCYVCHKNGLVYIG